jgi:aminoglycoside 6'-N-acetyltransferase
LNRSVDTGSRPGSEEGSKVGFDLGFRPPERTDFVLLQRWLCSPHVAQWWERLETQEDIEREFGPCVDGKDPTLVFVIVLGGRDIGIIQTYLLSDNPQYEAAVQVRDAAGVDLFIGAQALLDSGLGRRILAKFVRDVGWSTYPAVKRYIAGPSEKNVRSLRAFEAAGFEFRHLASVPDEPEPEAVMVLERPPAP